MVTFIPLVVVLLLPLPFEILCTTETPKLQPSTTNSSNVQNLLLDINNCSQLEINANTGFHFRGETISILRHATEWHQPRFGLIRMYESVRPVCLEIILEYTTIPISKSLVLTATCNHTTVQMFGVDNFGDGCGSLVVNGISSGEKCLPLGGRVQIECDLKNYMVMGTELGDVLALSSGATPTAIGLDNVERIETRFGVDMWHAQRKRQRDSKTEKCNCDAFHNFQQWAFGCTGSKEMSKGNATRVTKKRSRSTAVLATFMMVVGLPAVVITIVYHAVMDLRQHKQANGAPITCKRRRKNTRIRNSVSQKNTNV